VGPIWKGGRRTEDELLASCYRSVLAVAAEHGILTIAFLAISCGAFGYPLARAAQIAVRQIRAALDGGLNLETVLLVAYDDDVYEELSKVLNMIESGDS
jgi:O-acetyl-ADP-ribose deacetylase (regulator of RNase III)